MADDPKKIIEDVYLGDGVYASFDGYHIVLDLRGQDNFTKIHMEPQVLEALERFRLSIKKVFDDMVKGPSSGR